MELLTIIYLMINLSLDTTQSNELVVNVAGFRNDKGKCLAYLYDKKNGFPSKPKEALKSVSAKIIDGKATLVFKDITLTNCAISVIHDENDNKDFDTNFIGIPKEGFGASNNPKSSFGPPSFEDAKFGFPTKNGEVSISIRYL